MALLLIAEVGSAAPPSRTVETKQKSLIALAARPKGPNREKGIKMVMDELLWYERIAKKALASQWKDLSIDQRREFTGLIAKLVQKRYRFTIDQMVDRNVRYDERPFEPGGYTVRTSWRHSGSKSTVLYLDLVLATADGSPRIVDICPQGECFVAYYRDEIRSVLRTEGYGRVVHRLKELVANHRTLLISVVGLNRMCIRAERRTVLAQIEQELPLDILAKRHLSYENMHYYTAPMQWNRSNNPHGIRTPARYYFILRNLHVKKWLKLWVDCMPSRGGWEFVINGRLEDLDIMDELLAAPVLNQGALPAGGTTNRQPSGVFDAVSISSVSISDWQGEYAGAMRTLLARLLHVPEGWFETRTEFDLASEISVPFFSRRNDGSEKGFQGRRAPLRTYVHKHAVIELPDDVADRACMSPVRYWTNLGCRGAARTIGCKASVRHEVKPLSDEDEHEATMQALHKGDAGVGTGERIVFDANPYRTTYLIRSLVVAAEPGDQKVGSTPAFTCVRTKSRSLYFGLRSNVGFPFSLVAPTRYQPASSYLPVSLDLFVLSEVFSRDSVLLSSSKMGGGIGFSMATGSYPCERATFPCDVIASPRYGIRLTRSVAVNVRAHSLVDLVRIDHFGLVFSGDMRLGVEQISSDPSFRRDGLYWLWGAGVGLGVSYTWADDPESLAPTFLLSSGVSFYNRFLRAAVLAADQVDAAGVPDGGAEVTVGLTTILAPASF